MRLKPKMSSSSQKAMDIKKSYHNIRREGCSSCFYRGRRRFQHLMQVVEPTFVVPSRKTVMKEIRDMHEQARAKVVTELGQASSVALTADFWSSIAILYLGGTAHFITNDWEMKSCNLHERPQNGTRVKMWLLIFEV